LALAEFLVGKGANCNTVYQDSDYSGSALGDLVVNMDFDDRHKPLLALFMTRGGGDLDAGFGFDQGADRSIREDLLRSLAHPTDLTETALAVKAALLDLHIHL
jgi:hypothetical protein